MAKTERFLRVCWRKLEVFELRRRFPKNWESEDEVKEEEGRGGRRPRKRAGERGMAGLLWDPLKLKLCTLTDSVAIFGYLRLWEIRRERGSWGVLALSIWYDPKMGVAWLVGDNEKPIGACEFASFALLCTLSLFWSIFGDSGPQDMD